MSEFDSDRPAGPDYPQDSPTPPGYPIRTDRHRLAGVALRAAARRAVAELESGSLTLPGGDTIEIVTVAQVIEWLDGLAVRAEVGELL